MDEMDAPDFEDWYATDDESADTLLTRDENKAATRLAALYLQPDLTSAPDEERIDKAASSLPQEYSRRLYTLRLSDWRKLLPASDYRALRRCRPSLAEGTPGWDRNRCGKWLLCPWCWARRMDRLYHQVQRAWQAGEHLVAAAGAEDIPAEENATEPPHVLIRKRFHSFRKVPLGDSLDTLGAWWAMTVEPGPQIGRAYRWRVTSRLLVLVPAEAEVDMVPASWRVRRLTEASDLAIGEALCVVGRYPEGMLRGDLKQTVGVLVARKGMRLTEVGGRFRQRIARPAPKG